MPLLALPSPSPQLAPFDKEGVDDAIKTEILMLALHNDPDKACEMASELCKTMRISYCEDESFFDMLNERLGFYKTYGMKRDRTVDDYNTRVGRRRDANPPAALFREYRNNVTYLEETDEWQTFRSMAERNSGPDLTKRIMKALWWLHQDEKGDPLPPPSTAQEHFQYMCLKRTLFKHDSKEHALIRQDEPTVKLMQDMDNLDPKLGYAPFHIEDVMGHVIALFHQFFTRDAAISQDRPAGTHVFPPDTKYIPGYVEIVSNSLKHTDVDPQNLVWYSSKQYPLWWTQTYDRLQYGKIEEYVRYTIRELAIVALEADPTNFHFINPKWMFHRDIVALVNQANPPFA